MKFSIHESNIERLEKKIVRIKNKCARYGNDFDYKVVGEEFKDYTDDSGVTRTTRYIVIDVEGIAKVHGWKFIASVDYTENGNIINKVEDVEVPERYYNCPPKCEHCNTNRFRRYTFIVQNEETGEFKQVGKSCLKDFTHGMSAEAVASYTAMFGELIEGETPDTSSKIESVYEVKEYLLYVAETIRNFGYVKSENPAVSTKNRAAEYFGYNHGWYIGYYDKAIRERLAKEIKKYDININRPESVKLVENALNWLSEQSEDNNYIHNLKTACSLEYIKYNHFGIVASLLPTYDRNLIAEAKREEAKRVDKLSNWVGNIGDKVEIEVESVKVLTGWNTDYGYTYVYKIVDTNGNIYTWKTSKNFETASKIKGTIKAHNEYREVKQTEITRCRITA